ncbi:MAG TPA: cupin domain-containing protein [Gemmatimonadales bacterium]
MRHLDPVAAARSAIAPNPSRPASALVHDSPDARLVVFRIAPGQEVPPHTSPSTVMLTVLAGRGTLSGADGARECGPGEMVTYEPEEIHAMRADTEELLLLATITPRPGERPAPIAASARAAEASR